MKYVWGLCRRFLFSGNLKVMLVFFFRYSVDVRPGEISRQNSLVREGETSSGETSPANDTSEEKGTGIVLSVKVYHIHGRVRDRVRAESWILEKVFKFSQLFSRPGKVWKIELKSWKYGRKPWVFLKATTSASQKKSCRVGRILFNLACTSWKKLCLCVSSSSQSLYWSRISLEKEIIFLEKVWKKSGKSLEF